MTDDKDKPAFGDTQLGQCIGFALIILAVTIGVGSCCRLADMPKVKPQPQIERQK